MKLKFLALSLLLLGITASTNAFALNPRLLNALIESMSKNTDDALKHGDEVLKNATPNTDKNLPSATPSGDLETAPAIGRGVARADKYCLSKNLSPNKKMFPDKTEILVITGSKVNIRKCGSTSCPILGALKSGQYRVNVISEEKCWIRFEFDQRNVGRRQGYVYERYATVK